MRSIIIAPIIVAGMHVRRSIAVDGPVAARLFCFAWLLSALAAPARCDELRLEARQLFDKSVTDNLHLSADGSAIELAQGELLEDDGPAAGFSYRPNEERLSESIWIRKELLVPDPRAKQATLLVGPGGDLQAQINGRPVPLKPAGKAGGYWQAYQIPPDVLRRGSNDIVLHGSGKVWIARADEFAAGSETRTEHPNRSARSTDGGKTWDDRRLGPRGDIDGEYYVRLFLEHYRSRGKLTLPVIDLGNLAGREVAAPLSATGSVQVHVRAETGQHGSIRTRVRSGATRMPTDPQWSDWTSLDPSGGQIPNPRGRYLQIALEMATADALETPRLQKIIVRATPKYAADWPARLTVVDAHNEQVIRTSIPFDYEPLDHPKLKKLREHYKLDDVVAGAKDEMELITRLASWSASRWVKGHLRESYPDWDALEILKPHADGTPVGGFCQQYNLVFLQACESFGLVGRAVSIGAGDHGGAIKGGGHEVVEVWSNQFRKWMYIDGNLAWYAIDAASTTPLSLWELRERQLRTLRGQTAPPIKIVHLAETSRRWTGLDSWPPFLELRLIPRSNFLERKSPLPLNQGMRGWFWTGHHVWTDKDYPASLLYSRRVSHRANFEWTLNQARYVLEAREKPGELRVHLDTQTPSFETFVAKIDGEAPQPVAFGFFWKLHAGKNRLEVRPRNKLGREGIASWIVLEY